MYYKTMRRFSDNPQDDNNRLIGTSDTKDAGIHRRHHDAGACIDRCAISFIIDLNPPFDT
jgi:hypothetical protein